MYLGQGPVLMSAYLIYTLHSLNCVDKVYNLSFLKMTLYISSLQKSLFKESKTGFWITMTTMTVLKYKNAAIESKEYTNYEISVERLHNDKNVLPYN